jgi:hypothetical protein
MDCARGTAPPLTRDAHKLLRHDKVRLLLLVCWRRWLSGRLVHRLRALQQRHHAQLGARGVADQRHLVR